MLLFAVEVSPAHIQIDRLSHGKLVYAPLLACLVVCVWRLLDGSDQVIAMRVALAALAGSYAVHVLGPDAVRALGWGTDSWAYQVKVGLKEGTELSGWVLLVVALWRVGGVAVGREKGSRDAYRTGTGDPPRGAPRPPVRPRVEASPMGCRQSGRG
ncbi:MAG TPA: hypothetical protein VMA77_28720 [Solirubrobacteraceae bacterium]|nr:hypothetical protein [Solirubrobacteraceae bacterium]